MSHAATNWAIQQRGLKPTTKIVLWHLCDRYNPDYGCFPSQARLAYDCEISRATLNRHLDTLEERKLIRRVRMYDPETRQQRNTRYLLGFESGFEPDPGGGREGSSHEANDAGERPSDVDNPFTANVSSKCQEQTLEPPQYPCLELRHGTDGENESGDKGLEVNSASNPCPDLRHGAVSHFGAIPCLKNDRSRVSKRDTNPVREPVSKPVKEEECAQAREDDFEGFFEELLKALGMDPNSDLPGWWQGWPPREHVRRWRDELGLGEDRILDVARRSRDAHPTPPDGPKALDRAMERALRAGKTSLGHKGSQASLSPSTPPPSTSDVIAKYATWLNGESFLPTSAITNTMRDRLIASGLVTRERLYERGIR